MVNEIKRLRVVQRGLLILTGVALELSGDRAGRASKHLGYRGDGDVLLLQAEVVCSWI